MRNPKVETVCMSTNGFSFGAEEEPGFCFEHGFVRTSKVETVCMSTNGFSFDAEEKTGF